MFKVPPVGRVALSFLALAAVVAGCGSANGEGAPALSKAEFIKKADAICAETDKAQDAAQRDFEKKYPKAPASPRWEEKFILVVGLPPIQVEAEKIGDLAPPSDDEEEIGEIVAGLEKAVREVKENPSTMLEPGTVGPFADVFLLTERYGFKACSTPI